MKTRKLKDVAYDIADLNATIRLMKNYISSLQLEVARNKSTHDLTLFTSSLIHENGLGNLFDNLDVISRRVETLADEVLDQYDLSQVEGKY